MKGRGLLTGSLLAGAFASCFAIDSILLQVPDEKIDAGGVAENTAKIREKTTEILDGGIRAKNLAYKKAAIRFVGPFSQEIFDELMERKKEKIWEIPSGSRWKFNIRFDEFTDGLIWGKGQIVSGMFVDHHSGLNEDTVNVLEKMVRYEGIEAFQLSYYLWDDMAESIR